jgi:hypothetical protein
MLQRVATEPKPALACFCANAGGNGRAAIYEFATSAGYEIVAELEHRDLAGAPRVDFCTLLARINLVGAMAVIVGAPDVFADAAIDRVVGFERLRERGIELIAASSPEAFVAEALQHKEILRALAVAAQFDAAVAASAAPGYRPQHMKIGKAHRKTYAEMEPEATLMAKRLYQASRSTGERITLREISARLAAAGFVQANQKEFHPEAIRRMINGQWPHTKSRPVPEPARAAAGNGAVRDR